MKGGWIVAMLSLAGGLCAAESASTVSEDCVPIPLSGQAGRIGMPFPVAVVVKNATPESEFAIEAWWDDRGGPNHSASREVRVGRGTYLYTLYLPVSVDAQGISRLSVRLSGENRKGSQPYTIPIRALSTGLPVLAVLAHDRFLAPSDFHPLLVAVGVVRRTEYLPDQWYGYEGYDVVFWDGQAGAPAQPVQRQALADWVRGGGRLVLIARANDPSVRSPLPDVVPDFNLNTTSGPDGRDRLSSVEFAGVAGRLMVEQRLGLGAVAFVQADAFSMSGWSDEDKFAVMGAASSWVEPEGQELLAMDTIHTLEDQWRVLRPCLASMSGYTRLDFTPILVVMLIYILIVSLADYLVLRKARRLPWTWVTFPLLIILFSVISYRKFYEGRAGELIRNEVMWRDVAKDGAARIVTWSCIRNNSNKPIRVETKADRFITTGKAGDEYYGGRQYQRAPPGAGSDASPVQDLTPVQGPRCLTIPGYVGSFNFFNEEWVERSARPPFSAALKARGASLAGEVSDRSGKDLQGPVFVLYHGALFTVDGSKGVIPCPPNPRERQQFEQIVRMWQYGGGYGLVNADRLRLFCRYQSLMEMARAATGDIRAREEYPVRMAYGGAVRQAGGQDAVILAFYEEKATVGGMPVNRQVCVRQVVDVAPER